MTLEELLAALKSAKRIEGDDVPVFLAKRLKSMEDGGVHGYTLVKNKDGRVVFTKTIPTGFQLKGVSVTLEQSKKWAADAGVNWEDGFAAPSLRVIPWRMSDERPDRHGDIIRQNFAWENFDKNPVLLDAHRWEDLPIGNVIMHETVNVADGSFSGRATNAMCLFATQEMNPKADIAFRLARARLLRAGSVGIFPQVIIYVEDQKERDRLGLGRWGIVIDKSEMAEFSPCSVPANPGAIQNSLGKAIKSKLVLASDHDVVHELLASAKHLFTPESFKEADDGVTRVFKECFPELRKTTDAPSETDLEKRIGELETELAAARTAVRELTSIVTETAVGLKAAMGVLFENQKKLTEQPPEEKDIEDEEDEIEVPPLNVVSEDSDKDDDIFEKLDLDLESDDSDEDEETGKA